MNGAIMGMSKAEISKKLDEIVDFSGCERYIDTPVKRYSSGMTVRLGFAVAAHLDPEILVVDEVLAVGDAEFQKKAIGKMQDVSRREGRTVLFVSHNMASIRALCKTGILLEDGHIKNRGDINNIVDEYIVSNNTKLSSSNKLYYEDINSAPGNDNIRIKSYSVTPLIGGHISVQSGFVIDLCFKNYVPNALIDACIELQNLYDVVVFQKACVISPNSDSKIGYYSVRVIVPGNTINDGTYKLKIWFGRARKELLWGFMEHSITIDDVLDPNFGYIIKTPGIVRLNLDTSICFNAES